jgi:hypothetical protein
MIRTLRYSPLFWLLIALCAGQAARGAEPIGAGSDKAQRLEQAFGSTIVSTFPDGRQGELWLQRDGGYTAMGRRQNLSSGTWRVKGDKLCLHQHAPFPVPFWFCTPIPTSGIDKPWPGKSPTGEPLSIRLVKGIYGRDPPKKEGVEAATDGGPKG